MIVTMSEKAAKAYLAALSAEGIAGSVEVYSQTDPHDGITEVAVLVVPLDGFSVHPLTLIQDFVDQLSREGFINRYQLSQNRAG